MLPARSASPSLATSRAIAERVAVERLEIVLPADHAHLLAVAVVGERDHDLGTGAQELAMQLAHGVGEVEHDLGHVRAALQVAAALELEQVALGAEDDAVVESLEETLHARQYRGSGPGGVEVVGAFASMSLDAAPESRGVELDAEPGSGRERSRRRARARTALPAITSSARPAQQGLARPVEERCRRREVEVRRGLDPEVAAVEPESDSGLLARRG